MAQLILVVAMLVLLWALLIRPQRARQRQQNELLSSIDPGDEILTVGGLYGIVQEVDEDDDLVVEIADGIHVRIARRAVGGVVKPEDEADEADEADASEPAAEAAEAASGEERVNDSEDFVSEDDAEDPAALERR
ncbi:MAG TPA: preprotein translocase subunit YajC [Gaiella sp.]|nr:preprotein translocase subunit YajC [Gaiella sp.]